MNLCITANYASPYMPLTMTKMIHFLFFLLLICGIQVGTYAQASNKVKKQFGLSDELIMGQIRKSRKHTNELNKATLKYLDKLYRKEQFLKKLVRKVNPSAADQLFSNTNDIYTDLKRLLQNEQILSNTGHVYSAHLDSMKTAFKFFKTPIHDSSSKEFNRNIGQALQAYDKVQMTLNQTNAIQQKLEERIKLLEGKLIGLGFRKNFNKYQRDIIYYQAQLKEYKTVFDNPSKAEAKVLELLSNIPAFKTFFKKHSQLGALFNLPGDESTTIGSVAGLQTRSMVMEQLTAQTGSQANVAGQITANVVTARSTVSALIKNGSNLFGGESSDIDMPDYKINSQKTKTFFKRLEFGMNLQSTKSNFYFPTTTDIGTSVGYKIRSNLLAGVGASYKVGWGKDFRHIAITHEGVGLRTYMEMKLKGSLWVTGGGELNYRSPFTGIDQLHDYTKWQKSALAGLSKKYKVNKKLKGNLQLLYDFLHRNKVPSTQAVKIRVGYSFN